MFTKYLSELNNCLKSVDQKDLDSAVEMIKDTISNKRKIFVAGNGGSSALASHFVVDLLKMGHKSKRQIFAYSLVDSIPTITATANDFNFDEIFSWQLNQLAEKEDLFVVISSSGNSTNILNGVLAAKDLQLKTLAFTGFKGGKVKNICDLTITSLSDHGNYGPVEDSHSIICHYITRSLGI